MSLQTIRKFSVGVTGRARATGVGSTTLDGEKVLTFGRTKPRDIENSSDLEEHFGNRARSRGLVPGEGRGIATGRRCTGRRPGGTRWTSATSWPRSAIARASRTTNEPVEGLDHEGFGFLDESLSVAQAAVVSTDGQEYVLVTLTGFDLTHADVDVAAQLVAAVEAAR